MVTSAPQQTGEDGRLTVRMDGDKEKSITFDPCEMRHFDHGYAVTSHSSQGLTSQRVLVNMDTESIRHSSTHSPPSCPFRVHRTTPDVFTNDAANLVESLSKDVSKTAAIDLKGLTLSISKAASPEPRTTKSDASAGLGLAP